MDAISAVMRADPLLVDRLKRASQHDVLVAPRVVAKPAYGIARLPKSRRRQFLQERLELIATTFERIEWTDAVSTAFGDIRAALERKGRRIEDFDAAIAAHALANDATLATASIKHMAGVPNLLVEDWLAPA